MLNDTQVDDLARLDPSTLSREDRGLWRALSLSADPEQRVAIEALLAARPSPLSPVDGGSRDEVAELTRLAAAMELDEAARDRAAARVERQLQRLGATSAAAGELVGLADLAGVVDDTTAATAATAVRDRLPGAFATPVVRPKAPSGAPATSPRRPAPRGGGGYDAGARRAAQLTEPRTEGDAE